MGDYEYSNWLESVVVTVLQDEDYDANGLLTLFTPGSAYYTDRACMHEGWGSFQFDGFGGDSYCEISGSAVLIWGGYTSTTRVALSNVAVYAEELTCAYEVEY